MTTHMTKHAPADGAVASTGGDKAAAFA